MGSSHHELFRELEISSDSAGVFGICYSILTWSGIAKGLSPNPAAIAHSISKLIETGHATTFLWVKSNDVFVKSQVWIGGVAFTMEPWARPTPNATTYVYYIDVDEEFLQRYVEVAKRLRARRGAYSLLMPNVSEQRFFESCVSASHHLMAELGLGSALMARGYWTPSAANWVNWFSTFAPRTVAGFTWKYRCFPNRNTAILVPFDPYIDVTESIRSGLSTSGHPVHDGKTKID